jgi:hypothetical protein
MKDIMTVVPIVVHMVNVFMIHGHVMVLKTAMMAQMKLIVVVVNLLVMKDIMTVVPIVVHMVNVFMIHGHVMVLKTAMMAQMKLIVAVANLLHVMMVFAKKARIGMDGHVILVITV